MNNLSDAKDKRRRNIRYTCGIGTEQPGKSEQRRHKAHVLDGTEMPTEEEMEAIAECLDFTEAPTALTKQVRLRVPEITLTLKKSSEEPKSEQTDLNANFNAPQPNRGRGKHPAPGPYDIFEQAVCLLMTCFVALTPYTVEL